VSLSCAHLAGVLTTKRALSADEVARLREQWRQQSLVLTPNEWRTQCAVLDSDMTYQPKAAPRDLLRGYDYRLPIPFRWGPNGSLYTLLAMLIGAVAVGWLASLVFS
jgi:hypothetical protein